MKIHINTELKNNKWVCFGTVRGYDYTYTGNTVEDAQTQMTELLDKIMKRHDVVYWMEPDQSYKPIRYFLTSDGDCRYYIVPLDKEEDWNEWLELIEDGEYHQVPDFAEKIEGGILSFENPAMDGEPLFT